MTYVFYSNHLKQISELNIPSDSEWRFFASLVGGQLTLQGSQKTIPKEVTRRIARFTPQKSNELIPKTANAHHYHQIPIFQCLENDIFLRQPQVKDAMIWVITSEFLEEHGRVVIQFSGCSNDRRETLFYFSRYIT